MQAQIKIHMKLFIERSIFDGTILLYWALIIGTYSLTLYGSLIFFGIYFGSGVFIGLNACLYYLLKRMAGMGMSGIQVYHLIVYGSPLALAFAGLAIMGILSIVGVYR